MSNPATDRAWPFCHVAATTLVKTGPGTLHKIVLNGLTTQGDAVVYDGIDNTGAVIAVLHIDLTTSVSVQPIGWPYDAKVDVGIHIEFDQTLACDLTVMHD